MTQSDQPPSTPATPVPGEKPAATAEQAARRVTARAASTPKRAARAAKSSGSDPYQFGRRIWPD